jgi:hypothetical protein
VAAMRPAPSLVLEQRRDRGRDCVIVFRNRRRSSGTITRIGALVSMDSRRRVAAPRCIPPARSAGRTRTALPKPRAEPALSKVFGRYDCVAASACLTADNGRSTQPERFHRAMVKDFKRAGESGCDGELIHRARVGQL